MSSGASKLAASSPGRTIRGLCAAWLILTMLLIGWSSSAAQTADTSQIDAYLKAIQQPDVSGRLAALERFARSAPASSLRTDALEWIVWDERQTHNDAAASTWAEELLKSDPDNPLGLAMAADAERRALHSGAARHPEYEQIANHGLWSLPALRRPEGMSHDEFSRLQQQVEGMLNAAVGTAALDRKDYLAARSPLARAVNAFPNDAQLVYGAALADLSGDKPNRQQGYWLLARAVNLAAGTPAARQMEEFGRKRYKQDGGSDQDWDRFLVAAAGPGSAAMMVESAPASSAGSRNHGSETRATQVEPRRPSTVDRRPSTRGPRRPSTVDRRPSTLWKEEEPPATSTAAANALPPIATDARRTTRRSGPPVSLGILVETSMAKKGTRQAIVNSLSDLIRRLGVDDEAFILTFSNNLVFEEDLTGDAGRLEHALDQIRPHPGTALLDAAGFAAGHLRRIAKNDSRVLLVISDGKNASSRIPALASSSEIRASGVKIYCIGVDVTGNDGMYRLQGLATATGGTAAFVTAPDQFRAAAQQVAGHMGIRFDY